MTDDAKMILWLLFTLNKVANNEEKISNVIGELKKYVYDNYYAEWVRGNNLINEVQNGSK